MAWDRALPEADAITLHCPLANQLTANLEAFAAGVPRNCVA
ncbi:hypothetical protein PQQ52_08655 [Paraburkholderia sediminicola]